MKIKRSKISFKVNSSPEESGKKTEKEKINKRREEVLKSGRKFKYPLQYSKHKLVIVTIAVAVIALVGSVVAGYFLLYKIQTTSDVMYRLTKVLPLNVAKIDGENVHFSDYLMLYKSSIRPIEEQTGSFGEGEDGKERQNYFKRSALNDAEEYAYANKIAREQNIKVEESEIDASFTEHREVGGTELTDESFLRIVKDNFGLSKDEYRYLLRLSILKKNVSVTIDENAKNTVKEVQQFLSANNDDFKKARDQFGERVEYEETASPVGPGNVDGGRARKALTLGKDQVSEPFVSTNGDGYYIIKCLEKSGGEVTYTSLFVPFTEFNKRIKSLRDSGKIEEYIEL